MPSDSSKKRLVPRSVEQTGLVTRSEVPSSLPYSEYKAYLRVDFYHACAYCTTSEAEARAIRFTIDHYEPRGARPDLENDYTNLMYACDTCNILKGDRCPPATAREAGHRFFRPDTDLRRDHFERHGIQVLSKSTVGFYTIESLDLNRSALKRVRELRERLTECDRYVVEGIMALRSFPIDALPKELRSRTLDKVREAMVAAEDIGAAIDQMLQEYGRSSLIDPDTEAPGRGKRRAATLKELEALYPGKWRAPRQRRPQGKRR